MARAPAGESGPQQPPASYPLYKFEKALFDYERLHTHMLGASPDHVSFNAIVVLQALRFAVDDSLADLASAWDAVLLQVLDDAGATGSGLRQRLSSLESLEPRVSRLLTKAWEDCFKQLNDCRNFKQHEGFWPPSFGIGQGGGPFAMDLVLKVRGATHPGVYLMRECRYALAILGWVDTALNLGHGFAELPYGCADCNGDSRLEDSASWFAPVQPSDESG